MNWKLLLAPRRVLNTIAALVGIGFLVVLVFSFNALFAARTRQPTQTASQPLDTPTLPPIFPPVLETSAPTVVTQPTVVTIAPKQTGEWGTFSVPELSYSMQYPTDWKLSVSKSMGYPLIQLLDPVAQQVALPKTEVDQGALIQIYTEQWPEKDPSISSLIDYITIDPTVGLISDPNATQEIKESSVGQITGAKSVVVTRYYREETFAFLRDQLGKTLVFRIVLTIFSPPEAVAPQTYHYLQIFQQMLNTLEFTGTR